MKKISEKKLKKLEPYLIVGGQQFLNMMCCNYYVPEWFIHKYRAGLNWDKIVKHQNISETFLRDHISYINDYSSWDCVSKHSKVSLQFLKDYEKDIEWDNYTLFNELNKEIVTEFYSKMDIMYILQRNLIEEFITKDELEALEIMHQITK